jgi:AcrR family transcriptional regulator
MTKPKTARPSKKRDQIFRTAERLFSRYGSKRVTVEEICKEAGAAKMTFYKYFRNKRELVRAIRDQWVEQGFAKFDEIKALDIPFVEKVNLMTRWKAEFFSRMSSEFIQEMASIDEVLVEAKRRFLENLMEAQEQGEVRADLSPELIWLVVEKLSELTKDGSWQPLFSDFSEYQRQMRTLLFFGMLTRPDSGSTP